MTPGKLISIIVILILLALAAEGGYYWGYNHGLKNAPTVPTGSSQNQIPTPAPAVLFSAKDPADLQAAANAMALLFKPQVIDHLKNVPADAIWWSNWTIAIGGKVIALSDENISMELNPDQKVRSWTLPANTHYQIYNETTRQTSDTPKETVQLGDTVNFSVSFDTKSGEAREAWITKSVK